MFLCLSSVLLGVLMSAFVSFSEPEDLCNLQNSTFQSGERIVYKIYYNWKFIWVPAGEVSFSLSETEDSYHVDIAGTTYESYDNMFKVRDRYETNIDKETLLPKTFVRDIHEGNYIRYDSMVFNQPELNVAEFYGKSKTTVKKREFDLPSCTQDLVSVLYHLRNRDISDLKEGSKLPVSFFFSKKLYQLDVNIIEIKEKKIKGLGKFETIRARPELIAGSIFDEESYMDIWVSNDQNKIPLLIESPIRIGSVKAVLKSYDNLKYPFNEVE